MNDVFEFFFPHVIFSLSFASYPSAWCSFMGPASPLAYTRLIMSLQLPS